MTNEQRFKVAFRIRLLWLCAVLVVGTACARRADTHDGEWRAVVLNKAGEEIGFKLAITHTGEQVSGALVNGDQRVESTSGSLPVLKARRRAPRATQRRAGRIRAGVTERRQGRELSRLRFITEVRGDAAFRDGPSPGSLRPFVGGFRCETEVAGKRARALVHRPQMLLPITNKQFICHCLLPSVCGLRQ